MSTPQSIPEKTYYKIQEVCQYTDTQPYVLRFWESEFPQLAPEKSRSGQSMYRKEDIELVLRIKKLLYEQEYTITGARKALEDGYDEPVELDAAAETAARAAEGEAAASAPTRAEPAPAAPAASAAPAPAPAQPDPAESADTVARQRYEDAVDEIQELRLRLQEAETRLKKADQSRARAEERAARLEAASGEALERLRGLLEKLS